MYRFDFRCQLRAVSVCYSESNCMIQLKQGLNMKKDNHISIDSKESSGVGEVCLKYFVPFYLVAQNIYEVDEINLEEFIDFVMNFSNQISKKFNLPVKSKLGEVETTEWPSRDTFLLLPSKIENNGLALKALTLILDNYNQSYTSIHLQRHSSDTTTPPRPPVWSGLR